VILYFKKTLVHPAFQHAAEERTLGPWQPASSLLPSAVCLVKQVDSVHGLRACSLGNPHKILSIESSHRTWL